MMVETYGYRGCHVLILGVFSSGMGVGDGRRSGTEKGRAELSLEDGARHFTCTPMGKLVTRENDDYILNLLFPEIGPSHPFSAEQVAIAFAFCFLVGLGVN